VGFTHGYQYFAPLVLGWFAGFVNFIKKALLTDDKITTLANLITLLKSPFGGFRGNNI
jgi:hypothetical protein